jgi:carboxylate-amine ligase
LPFQFQTWQEYEAFVDDHLQTGVIEYLSDIRWDVRPSPRLGTVEVRICDGVSNLRELAALTALTHCLVVDLSDRLTAGEQLPTMPPWHVQENKWRSARYGLDAEIILDASARERLVTDDLADLLERLAPVARRLGCADELTWVDDIVRDGAAYQRQREVARRTGGDLVAVVDSVVAELEPSLVAVQK